jgi:hypothetical protein
MPTLPLPPKPEIISVTIPAPAPAPDLQARLNADFHAGRVSVADYAIVLELGELIEQLRILNSTLTSLKGRLK